MTVLHENLYWKISWDEETKCLYSHWLPESFSMTDEEYRKEIMLFSDFVFEYDAKLSLSDSVNFLFTVSPETQEWVITQQFSRALDTGGKGLEKIAVIMSHDTFAQLSTEQIIEDDIIKAFETQFFETHQSAEQWLFN